MSEFPKLTQEKNTEIQSVGGGICDYLTWNDDSVFNATIVVIMTLYNKAESIKCTLESILNQKGNLSYCVLILDDNSMDLWTSEIQHLLHNLKLVFAKGYAGNAWKARNLAHKIVKEHFKNHQWICRMDADDIFASDNSLQNIFNAMMNQKPDSLWILPSNDLKVNGKKIDRINTPHPKLFQKEILLAQLERLKNGDETAEIPSCNIWINKKLRIWYPEIESAEDHWLVTKILVYYGSQGLILPDILHATYSLSGETTKDNKDTGEFHRSRENLYHAVKFWFENTSYDSIHPVCLGYGGEGMVWLENGVIEKRFYPKSISDHQVDWLKKNIPENHPNIIHPKWRKENDKWIATYSYFESTPVVNPSRITLSNFIQLMLKHRFVCINIVRKNFRIVNGELCFIDIGQHIHPFEIRYFRDICARLYLLFIKGYSDTQLNQITLKIRNNIEELQKIDGFEDFYQRELLFFFNYQGFLKKPFRNVIPRYEFPSVTLLIKGCAMEYNVLEKAIYHIIHQIRQRESYFETILLIDSKETNFLRQYHEPNLQKTIQIAELLRKRGMINRILISPSENKYYLIQELNERWFNCKSISTHSTRNVPIFPQLWAFEQIQTRYVLQLDLDVLIHRKDFETNFIQEMLDALQEENIFSVGFNICQSNAQKFKKYDAPQGKYVPEVRFGLLDLERIKQNRPFPNEVIDGQLKFSWYRSIEKYQQETNWRSLRGGNPSIFYIHPPNDYKKNPNFMNQVRNLVEQGYIPQIQHFKWDLVGTEKEWKYRPRYEKIMLLIYIEEPNIHWLRGSITSIVEQQNADWGVILINTSPDLKFHYWLLDLIKPWQSRITLIQSNVFQENTPDYLNFIENLIPNTDAFIIPLKSTEVLKHKDVLNIIQSKLTENTIFVALGSLYYRDPLIGSSIPKKLDFAGELFQNLIKDNLIRGCKVQYLKIMRQILENPNPNQAHILSESVRRQVLYIPEYFILNPKEIYSFNKISKLKNNLRPSIYIPNLKRIEIDLTYICNLRCAGCCRSCAQAPEHLHISIDQIYQFLLETEKKNFHWESVHLLGGEPTLHPQFLEIISILTDWFEKNSPDTDLKVISNGHGSYVQNKLKQIPKRWLYQTSFKEGSDNEYFEPFNLAPIDIPKWQEEDFRKGCWITQDSGIGLTPLGYFHCAIAGGIERIMKIDGGFSSIPSHPWEFLDMMDKYCRYCGHFLNDYYHSRQDQLKLEISPNEMSETWQRAYNSWKSRKQDNEQK